MAFFVRPKKARKETPATKPREKSRSPPQRQPLPPAQPQLLQNGLPGGPHQQHPPPFQPAGLLLPAPPPPPPPYTSYPPGAYPPIVVNQHHYYLSAPPPLRPAPARPSLIHTPIRELDLDSALDLAKDICQVTGIPRLLDGALPRWHGGCGGQLVSRGGALVDEISDRFDNVLTMIDQGGYDGKESDIFAWQPSQGPVQQLAPPSLPPPAQPPVNKTVAEKGLGKASKRSHKTEHPKGQTTAAAAVVSESFFAKVDKYANSRLPLNLPPLKLYVTSMSRLRGSLTKSVTVTSRHGHCSAWPRSTQSGCTSHHPGAPSGMPTSKGTGGRAPRPWSSSRCPWTTSTPSSLPSGARPPSWTGPSTSTWRPHRLWASWYAALPARLVEPTIMLTHCRTTPATCATPASYRSPAR